MSYCVDVEEARLAVRAAFATYQPIRLDDSPGVSSPGSRCLVSPNAFNDKKIIQFVTSHQYCNWLLFAYGQKQDIELCKKITGLLWARIEPTIGRAGKKKRNRLALLCWPAIMQAKERHLTGKKIFSVSELCDILGIKENSGHWYRDYKPFWSAMAGCLDKWDSDSLADTYDFIMELDRFIQIEL